MQLIQSGHHRDKYHASDDVVILCPRGETPLDFFSFVCMSLRPFGSLPLFGSLDSPIAFTQFANCTSVHCDMTF